MCKSGEETIMSVSKFKQVSSLQQKDLCKVLGGQKFINHNRTNSSFVVDFSWPLKANY